MIGAEVYSVMARLKQECFGKMQIGLRAVAIVLMAGLSSCYLFSSNHFIRDWAGGGCSSYHLPVRYQGNSHSSPMPLKP
jgi:hypothetical protein